jgi:hypothetical protein
LSRQVLANVFVELTDTYDESTSTLPLERSLFAKGRVITSKVRLSDLAKLASHPDVNRIELGEPVAMPPPVVTSSRPPVAGPP